MIRYRKEPFLEFEVYNYLFDKYGQYKIIKKDFKDNSWIQLIIQKMIMEDYIKVIEGYVSLDEIIKFFIVYFKFSNFLNETTNQVIREIINIFMENEIIKTKKKREEFILLLKNFLDNVKKQSPEIFDIDNAWNAKQIEFFMS